MIKFVNVSKFYKPDTYALKDVSFLVKPLELVSVVGQSGAGKSTIFKLLISEEKATKGKIIIGDWDITDIKPNEVPVLRKQIGVVFQDFKLLPRKTVYENIAFALNIISTPKKKIPDIINQVLEIVGIANKKDLFPKNLSSGEAQRVAIARALAHHPKILIADEPTGNLDPITTRSIVELFSKINKLGTTVLLVTHDREIVNFLGKRVITLDGGRIISDQIKYGRYVI